MSKLRPSQLLVLTTLGLVILAMAALLMREESHKKRDEARLLRNNHNLQLVNARINECWLKNLEVYKQRGTLADGYLEYPSETEIINLMGPPELTVTDRDALWRADITPVAVGKIYVGKGKLLAWQKSPSQWVGFRVDADGKIRESAATTLEFKYR